jgi:hypothetical protein
MKKNLVLIIVVGVLVFYQSLNAQTWGASKRITWTLFNSYDPKVTVDSNNHIHVVWEEFFSYWRDIGYKKSTDGGTTWITKRLTWTNSLDPVIAVDSNNHIYVVFEQSVSVPDPNIEICLKKSTDGGATWTTKRLTWTSPSSGDPAIAIDSNNHIHVVWRDAITSGREIHYKKSTDGGTTWTTKRLTWTSGNSMDPDIAVDSNNNLHVAWYDETPGNPEIFYKKSTDEGITWTSKRLTYNSGDSWYPTITTDSSNHVHVAWEDYTSGDPRVYYKRSTDGGGTWATKRLTWKSGWNWQSAIAADTSNHIHVVWTNKISSDIEIYYRRSTNGGASWGSAQRLTWNSGDSQYSDISVGSNNNIHVVWYDGTPTVYEIYYKKGIQ